MIFTLRLKSGEYYDFSNIKEVFLKENDKIEILANFSKGKKYKRIELNTKMVVNLKGFIKFLRGNMKRFDYEGCCPHCDSVRLWKYTNIMTKTDPNDPRVKATTQLISSLFDIYECRECKKKMKTGTLKEINIVLYY